MKEIIEVLIALVENPDDLSKLPEIITKLEEYQTAVSTREAEDLERITKLQSANRNLLSQIPISTGDPEPPKDDKPTFEEAQKELLKALNTVGGH